MAKRLRIPVRKLRENDGIIVDGTKYCVIKVTSTHFDHVTVVVCFADYDSGVQRLKFDAGELVDVDYLVDQMV